MVRSKGCKGRVSLVGAGPGDPELLTVKALRALESADVVFHDALVPAEVVALARGITVPVGKRAGRKSTGQDEIIRLMIRAAKSGRKVVRLKCGDPFVFGRGGEELLSLRENGIPVDVVPGVTSAIAAASAAGVPVTHRGLSSGFVVLTGQPSEAWRDAVEQLRPESLTLIFMMALGARHQIGRALQARGWSRETPVLVTLGATQTRAWTWKGSVGKLATLELPEKYADLPGTIVVGKVAGLATCDVSEIDSGLVHDLELDLNFKAQGGAA